MSQRPEFLGPDSWRQGFERRNLRPGIAPASTRQTSARIIPRSPLARSGETGRRRNPDRRTREADELGSDNESRSECLARSVIAAIPTAWHFVSRRCDTHAERRPWTPELV